MVRVKICGITSAAGARSAAASGADALGFNFVKQSPRYIPPEKARAVIVAMPPLVVPVGVFADESARSIGDICDMCGIRTVQLHGNESPAFCDKLHRFIRIKAIRIASPDDLRFLPRFNVDAFLLDTHVPGQLGGTGETFDWGIAAEARTHGNIIVAGGLTPDNVADAVRAARPFAVDVASGVEAVPGRKDRRLMVRFIREAKTAI